MNMTISRLASIAVLVGATIGCANALKREEWVGLNKNQTYEIKLTETEQNDKKQRVIELTAFEPLEGYRVNGQVQPPELYRVTGFDQICDNSFPKFTMSYISSLKPCEVGTGNNPCTAEQERTGRQLLQESRAYVQAHPTQHRTY